MRDERLDDMRSILESQAQLKSARRKLYAANAKRARRASRVQAAIRAFDESLMDVEAAQEALRVAQRLNDSAFKVAADHTLAYLQEGS